MTVGILFILITFTEAFPLQIPSASAGAGVRGAGQLQFLEWCKAHIIAPKCAIHTFKGGLRGVIATDDIIEQECLVKIPLDYCFMKRGDDDGSWPVDLSLQLLGEMSKGKESKWWPYLTVLPKAEELKSSLPIHWGAEEIEDGFGDTDSVFEDDVKNGVENMWMWRDMVWKNYRYSDDLDAGIDKAKVIQGPVAVLDAEITDKKVGQFQPSDLFIEDDEEDERMRRSVQNRKLIKIPSSSKPFGPSEPAPIKAGSASPKFERTEFDHALDLVQTRNCCPEPSIHLIVPFLDLLNHDASADTAIVIDDGDQTVRLITNKRIKRGEQVFQNYNFDSQLLSPVVTDQQSGTLFDMDLSAYAFVAYGFLPDVKEACVLLPLGMIRTALFDANSRVLQESAYETDGGAQASRPGSALAICQACGLQISQPFKVYRDGISLSLMAALRVLTASEAERQQLWASGPKSMRDAVLGEAGSVTESAKRQLLDLLTEEQGRLQTVLDEPTPTVLSELTRPHVVRKQHAKLSQAVINGCLEWALKL